MKKRIIITGSAGLMGHHLFNYLNAYNHNILCIDDLSNGVEDNIRGQSNFVKLDLCNSNKTEKIFNKFKPQVVHHLACWPHEGLSQFCPELVTKSVYLTSLSVFKAAINCKSLERLVFYSSMARYGNGNFEPPFTEDMPRAPEDIYAIGKCAAEKALEILASIHKFSYNIVVPRNIFGTGLVLDDPYRNVLGIWANSILRGKPVYIYGDGMQRRTLSYVDDILEPLAKLGFDEKVNNEIINLGSSQVYTINDLAQMMIDEFELKLKPIHLPERPCEVKDAFCSVEKSKELLGFKEEISVKEGIHKLVEWVKDVGPKEPRYLEKLEIEAHAPEVWTKKMLK